MTSLKDLELEKIELEKRLAHIELHKAHCEKFNLDDIFCGSCTFYLSKQKMFYVGSNEVKE